MKEIIVASILFAISIFLFFMSVRSFMEKGFLFNNAYIYASKEEREKMNKKPHYHQGRHSVRKLSPFCFCNQSE